MRILVIGGTRFIGSAAVRRLHALGHEIAVCHRRTRETGLPGGIVEIRCDRDRLEDSGYALRRFAPDVVLHTVVATQRQAQDAVALFTGVAGRFVMISSMDVYRAFGRLLGTEPGPLESLPVDEDSPLREVLYPYRSQAKDADDPRWRYDKIPAERVVLGVEGLPGTVLRLPMVLGPGDYQHRLFPLLRPMRDGRRAIVLQEDYARWHSTYVHVENVAEAVVLACTDTRARGRIYDVADEAVSILELGGAVAKAAGWDGEFVLVPRAELPPPLVVPWRVEQSLVGRGERIREELGWTPAVGWEEGLRRAVDWEDANPPDPVPEGVLAYDAQDEVLARLGRR